MKEKRRSFFNRERTMGESRPENNAMKARLAGLMRSWLSSLHEIVSNALTSRVFTGHALFVAAAFCVILSEQAVLADPIGSASGLPIPRYVSLKSDRVNLREGPSKDHRTTWIFQRAGLPVEITAEFEIWRKVRDSEGAEGWVLHSLLSGRRTALVAPWKKGVDSILFDKASTQSASVAILQPNVIANVRSCDGAWCKVSGEGFAGYIQQANLWGVYSNEKIE
jgi:SH3-like domain-containing protein